MTAITADYFRHTFPSRNSRASGPESRLVEHSLQTAKQEAARAASSLPGKALVDLAQVMQECSKTGWDGYEAKPITQTTFDRAHAFLRDLPPWMDPPDIVPEADGEIAIEWYSAPNQTFSISIGESGPIHYAGLFGHEREKHGVEPFNGTIPEEILQLISRLLRTPTARRAG